MHFDPKSYLTKFVEYEHLSPSDRTFFSQHAQEFKCYEFIDGFYIKFGSHNNKLWVGTYDKSHVCDYPNEWPTDFEHFLYHEAHTILAMNHNHIRSMFGGNFELTAVIVSNRKHQYTNHGYSFEKIIILENDEVRGHFYSQELFSTYKIRSGLGTIVSQRDMRWQVEFQRPEHNDFYERIYRYITKANDPQLAKTWISHIHSADSKREPPGLIFKHDKLSFVLLSGVYQTYKKMCDEGNVTLLRDSSGRKVVDMLYEAVEEENHTAIEKHLTTLALFVTKWKTSGHYAEWTHFANNQALYEVLHHIYCQGK